jgi:hypothetical protein
MPSSKKPTPKLLEGLAKCPKKQDVHAQFAERSQLLRWFHERSSKELKALRKAFEMRAKTTTTTNTKD